MILIVLLVSILSTVLIYFISILGTSPQTFEDAVRQQREAGFDLNAANKLSAAAKKKEKERLRKERKRAEAGEKAGGERGTPKAEKPAVADKKKKKKEKAAAVEPVPITTDESHDEAGKFSFFMRLVGIDLKC